MTNPESEMLPSEQQARRLMSLPPGPAPEVWMREPGPAMMPPQQLATVMAPGRPLVPSTELESVPLIVTSPSARMRMSPAGLLRDPTAMAPPGWTSTVQVGEMRMPRADWLLPPPTREGVMAAPGRTWSGRAPRTKEANHASGIGPPVSEEKKAQRSGSPRHLGGLVVKSARTFWSTTTGVPWQVGQDAPEVGVGVAVALGTGVEVGVDVGGTGVRVGVAE